MAYIGNFVSLLLFWTQLYVTCLYEARPGWKRGCGVNGSEATGIAAVSLYDLSKRPVYKSPGGDSQQLFPAVKFAAVIDQEWWAWRQALC